MFRPYIQRLYILILMAIFCVVMVIISFNSKFIDKKPYYNEKIEAAKYMNDALKVLKKKSKTLFGEPDSSYDPLETGLVFFEDGLDGNLDAKLTTLNPNFAAFIVELFAEAGLEPVNNNSKNIPKIAVAFTGSMPGANLAVLSACKSMGFEPVIITSLSSSNWGACKYDTFSWLDMEDELINSNKIYFNYRSVASSIGKGRDSGIDLVGGDLTRRQIINAIKKYESEGVQLIYKEGEMLPYYIKKRMKIYDNKNDNAPYDLFVNVGGGVSSVGWYRGISGIKKMPGFIPIDSLNKLYDEQLIPDCVMSEFSQRENNPIPAINIIDIENLIGNNLPMITLGKDGDGNFIIDQVGIGEGPLFTEKRYNMIVVIICLISSLILVLSIGIHSHFQIKKRMTSYEPDSIS